MNFPMTTLSVPSGAGPAQGASRIPARVYLEKWGIFVLAAVLYLYVKSFCIQYTGSGDENAYYYMARLMVGGKIAYRDFFYAHPPLQLLLLTLVYAVFGFNIAAMKATAFIPILVGAAFLHQLAWERAGRVGSLVFLGGMLFGYEALKITSHPFGLNLTACWLMISFFFFVRGLPLVAGTLLALGALSGFYAAPWGLIPLFYYFRDWRKGEGGRRLLLFLVGSAGIFSAVTLCLLAVFGKDYFDPVIRYHFLKPPGSGSPLDVTLEVLSRNLIPFALPIFYFWAPRSRPVSAAIAAGLTFMAFLLFLDPLFTQYFMLPLPFLAWGGAVAVAGWLGRLAPRAPRFLASAAVVALIALTSVEHSRGAVFHEKLTRFYSLDEELEYIRKNSRDGDLIFGHVTTAPLLALLSGRDLALDMVDTNHMRFRAGLADVDETLARLKREPRLRFVVVRESSFWMDPRIQEFLARGRLGKVFREPRERILIYEFGTEP
ncbi:MAG TPA: hypothetical protein PLI51_01725 [bacterium]|nr:hypothetical protein [bacterium]